MISPAPTVTWMIPVLNGMPYLPYTLASIENQTYRDWRLVVWDNGSTDGTIEELHRWIPSRLPGVVIADRPMLLGLARAAMVTEFDSEFCSMIDADDINHPDRLEKQVAFLRANPDVGLVGSQLRRINSAGEDQGRLTEYPLHHEPIVQAMLITNPIGQPSVLVRRAAVLAVGNYRDFSPTHVEDYDLWLRLAGAGYRLANLPEELVDYRVHDRSTTQRSIAASRLEDAVISRASQAAPSLFGCDPRTLALLRERKHPHAINPLQQIARHLGAPGNDPWKSPEFYNAARQMIADRDVSSRLIAAIKGRGMVGGLSEIKAVAMQAVRRLKSRQKVPCNVL